MKNLYEQQLKMQERAIKLISDRWWKETLSIINIIQGLSFNSSKSAKLQVKKLDEILKK